MPEVIGLGFGARGDVSQSVHDLLGVMATRGATLSWRIMGARTVAEARGFLVARIRRDWGIAAVRAHARLFLSRRRYVGLTREQAHGLAVAAVAEAPGAVPRAAVPEAFEAGMAADAPPVRP